MITMMATKDDDKGDEKKLKGQSKDEFKMFKKESRTRMSSRCSRRNQEQFNFERSDILRDSIGHPSKKLCRLNLLRASVFNFERLDILCA